MPAQNHRRPSLATAGRNGGVGGHRTRARTPGELGPDDAGLALTDAQLEYPAALVSLASGHLGGTRRGRTALQQIPEISHRDCGLDVAEGGIWPWARYRQMIEKGAKEKWPDRLRSLLETFVALVVRTCPGGERSEPPADRVVHWRGPWFRGSKRLAQIDAFFARGNAVQRPRSRRNWFMDSSTMKPLSMTVKRQATDGSPRKTVPRRKGASATVTPETAPRRVWQASRWLLPGSLALSSQKPAQRGTGVAESAGFVNVEVGRGRSFGRGLGTTCSDCDRVAGEVK